MYNIKYYCLYLRFISLKYSHIVKYILFGFFEFIKLSKLLNSFSNISLFNFLVCFINYVYNLRLKKSRYELKI